MITFKLKQLSLDGTNGTDSTQITLRLTNWMNNLNEYTENCQWIGGSVPFTDQFSSSVARHSIWWTRKTCAQEGRDLKGFWWSNGQTMDANLVIIDWAHTRVSTGALKREWSECIGDLFEFYPSEIGQSHRESLTLTSAWRHRQLRHEYWRKPLVKTEIDSNNSAYVFTRLEIDIFHENGV